MGQVKQAILALVTSVMSVSTRRLNTIPRIQVEELRPLPSILQTLMLTTLNPELTGSIEMQASATRPAMKSSLPNCLLMMEALMALTTSSLLRISLTLSQTSEGRISSALACASRKPSTISGTDKPIFNSCSECSSSAPANMRTQLVPSPASCSCILEAKTSILAAGCSKMQ